MSEEHVPYWYCTSKYAWYQAVVLLGGQFLVFRVSTEDDRIEGISLSLEPRFSSPTSRYVLPLCV